MPTPLQHFMILLYERDLPTSARSVSPTVLEAHFALRKHVAEIGGRIVGGHAMAAGVTIRNNEVSPGQDTPSLAGCYVVEASDLDHAIWIGRMIPVVDGWVEVRPVLTA
ncbi:YciI family protein [Actinoplanes couchii]|uniref:YCII-related domain-containing protein n=1 Tax=Actinoplanes couchii TaxID=403638 RepID=A0ABQ3XKU9_9ACTN|nr:YciI family protein [Actinoplanes couchii]MDR6319491.1 hypothetical protein [Actinoplanes couchii]GID59119.1 hypothetical protein Aco03nite_075230 [Actinoplanes couchii]